MHRLFAAIRPPSAIRDLLTARMGGISGARWQDDDQLHLTLRFIGEVDRHVARDVHAALGSIRHPPFEIAVSGLGAFDKRGQTDNVWAGIAPQEPLNTLYKTVDRAMARVGLPPEQRAFLPHITLARLNRGAGPIDDFMAANAGFTSPPFRVDRFALFESRLTPEGAVYDEIESYWLN
jgi:2'-5' RNA ligase